MGLLPAGTECVLVYFHVLEVWLELGPGIWLHGCESWLCRVLASVLGQLPSLCLSVSSVKWVKSRTYLIGRLGGVSE